MTGFSTETLCWNMLHREGYNAGACKAAAESVVQYPYGRIMAFNVIASLVLPWAIQRFWNDPLDRYDTPELVHLGTAPYLGDINFKLRMDPHDTGLTMIGLVNLYAFTMSEVVPYLYTLM